MNSPSHRRTRSRPDVQVSSPETHTSKRRKMDNQVADVNLSEYQVNAVISSLAAPASDVLVVAATEHANDKNARDHREGVTAYAKICGRDWTFYVKELRISIGRPPDAKPVNIAPTEKEVDIDLGPSKLVSREHAVIEYDASEYRCWILSVLGRNGVKVDEEQQKRGSVVQLRSGSMFEIAGVQMLFVLPDQEPVIISSLLTRAQDLHVDTLPDVDAVEAALPTTQLSSEPGLPKNKRKAATQSRKSDPHSEANSSGTAGNTSQATMMDSALPGIMETPNKDSFTSPGYHRGIMLESTEEIDYSIETSKEIKPPYSYATLISQAILSNPDHKLTLANIYAWIQENYAFYRFAASGWQNSIRHNLSLNKAFQKVPRRTDEPGKGMKWQIAPDHMDEFVKKVKKAAIKSNKASSPRISSPVTIATSQKAQGDKSSNTQARVIAQPKRKGSSATKPTTQRSVTPPPFGLGLITPMESFTPDRGSRKSIQMNNKPKRDVDETLVDVSIHDLPMSPPPKPNGIVSSPYINDFNPSATAVTPAPQKHNPRLAPPSINQLPSSYLPTSSPAPFWKYVNFLTPGRPDHSSPIKSPHLRSSSPPVPPITSKLREASSPIKDKDNIFLGNRSQTKKESAQQIPSRNIIVENDGDDDDMDDFAGIDLSKGFEKIGKFHAQHAALRAKEIHKQPDRTRFF